MSRLPTTVIDPFTVFDHAVRNHLAMLKRSVLLIVLITLSEAFIYYLGHVTASQVISVILQVIGVLFFLYFYGAIIFQTQAYLDGQEVTAQEALLEMRGRYLQLLACAALILVTVSLYYVLITHIMQWWVGDTPNATIKSMIIFILLGVAPILIFLVFMIFAIPLVVIDQLNPLRACQKSYLLIDTRWIQAFTVYACMGLIYILVSPHTLHAHFLMHYHVFMIFVFVMYCLLLPFFFNYMLFMINDLKLRADAQVDFE